MSLVSRYSDNSKVFKFLLGNTEIEVENASEKPRNDELNFLVKGENNNFTTYNFTVCKGADTTYKINIVLNAVCLTKEEKGRVNSFCKANGMSSYTENMETVLSLSSIDPERIKVIMESHMSGLRLSPEANARLKLVFDSLLRAGKVGPPALAHETATQVVRDVKESKEDPYTTESNESDSITDEGVPRLAFETLPKFSLGELSIDESKDILKKFCRIVGDEKECSLVCVSPITKKLCIFIQRGDRPIIFTDNETLIKVRMKRMVNDVLITPETYKFLRPRLCTDNNQLYCLISGNVEETVQLLEDHTEVGKTRSMVTLDTAGQLVWIKLDNSTGNLTYMKGDSIWNNPEDVFFCSGPQEHPVYLSTLRNFFEYSLGVPYEEVGKYSLGGLSFDTAQNLIKNYSKRKEIPPEKCCLIREEGQKYVIQIEDKVVREKEEMERLLNDYTNHFIHQQDSDSLELESIEGETSAQVD